MRTALFVAITIATGVIPRHATACGGRSSTSCGHYRSMDETVTLELELVARWLDVPLDNPHFGDPRVVVGAGHVARANGARVRYLFGGSPKSSLDWLYGGFELEVDDVTSSPALVEASPNGPLDVRMAWLIGVRFPIGARVTLGSIQLTGELAPAFLAATYAHGDGGDAGIGLEARARAALWVTPSLTLGLGFGIDVVDLGDRSLVLSIGGHLDPYDGAR